MSVDPTVHAEEHASTCEDGRHQLSASGSRGDGKFVVELLMEENYFLASASKDSLSAAETHLQNFSVDGGGIGSGGGNAAGRPMLLLGGQVFG